MHPSFPPVQCTDMILQQCQVLRSEGWTAGFSPLDISHLKLMHPPHCCCMYQQQKSSCGLVVRTAGKGEGKFDADLNPFGVSGIPTAVGRKFFRNWH